LDAGTGQDRRFNSRRDDSTQSEVERGLFLFFNTFIPGMNTIRIKDNRENIKELIINNQSSGVFKCISIHSSHSFASVIYIKRGSQERQSFPRGTYSAGGRNIKKKIQQK
jgi:hypothetical protein